MLKSEDLQDKASIRRALKLEIDSLSPSQKAAEAGLICSQLQKLIATLPQARAVCVFIPLQDEPDIWQFIKTCSLELYLSRVKGQDLQVCKWDGLSSSTVKHQELGMQEASGQLNLIDDEQLQALGDDLIILVPGRAFDKELNRLGRGKAFYDKLLARLPRALRIGLCFDCQILDKLPFDEHDQKMNIVISMHKFLTKK